jgi:alkylhydroperoxidase/carboxymuconolactone decarboxylase family protein YurZ
MTMLTKRQQKLYDAFYESTHRNEFLDQKTELLVGISAAMAMDCSPCTRYYLEKARDAGVSEGEISEVLAKVMAVAAGQKRLQMEEVMQGGDTGVEAFDDIELID